MYPSPHLTASYLRRVRMRARSPIYSELSGGTFHSNPSRAAPSPLQHSSPRLRGPHPITPRSGALLLFNSMTFSEISENNITDFCIVTAYLTHSNSLTYQLQQDTWGIIPLQPPSPSFIRPASPTKFPSFLVCVLASNSTAINRILLRTIAQPNRGRPGAY
ncbi:hypothetical protein XPA_008038 [Xanthoria parietina]